MAWPARAELWGPGLAVAKRRLRRDRARDRGVRAGADGRAGGVARRGRDAAAARGVEVIELPIDDSWIRDSGPIFVTGAGGPPRRRRLPLQRLGREVPPVRPRRRAAERAAAPTSASTASTAPLVLEGGSITVDGEGTLITTEQCLLHPNRNPDARPRPRSRRWLREYLGVDDGRLARRTASSRTTTPTGTSTTSPRSSRPGRVLLQTVADATDPNYERLQENLELLRARTTRAAADRGDRARRAALHRGRGEPGVRAVHVNLYLANGAVDRAGGRRRPRPRRAGARDAARSACPRARGRRRAGADARLRRRRRALHHPAGAAMDDRSSASSSARSRLARAGRRRPTRASRSAIGAGAASLAPRSRRARGGARRGRPRGRRARARALVCLQELTLSPYFAVTADGPEAAGAVPEDDPRRADHEFAARWRPRPACTCTRRCTSAGADGGLGFNTAICVAPGGELVARTRKLHIPVTAGYYEDRYFRPGDSGYPVVDARRRAVRLPDLLGPVVPRARAGLLAGRRRGDRLPDRDRVRARPPRLRHRAAVGAGDHRQRHRERHVHGRGEPDRRRAAAALLRLVVHLRSVRPDRSSRRPATGPPCSSPTSTSTSAATGSRCSRSSTTRRPEAYGPLVTEAPTSQ